MQTKDSYGRASLDVILRDMTNTRTFCPRLTEIHTRQAAAASCRRDNEAMFFEDPPSSLHSSRLGFVTPGCVLDGADKNGLDRIKKRGKRDPCDIRPVLLFTLWHGPEGDVN